jgi:glycosyltransferase involved in cell wall biosynthesis
LYEGIHLKVVHLNQSDISGGAAIAAYQLHQVLRAAQVDSHLWVGEVHSGHPHITPVQRWTWIENQLSRLNRRVSLNYVNLISSFKLDQQACYQAADVLNLHNLHTGYFNYLALPGLTQQKPTVWTLHDMWSFTGHCAYSYDCDRWKIGCGACPYPQEYPEIEFDSSGWEWRLKRWVYQRSPLEIITPSQWLADQVRQSILAPCTVTVIPNSVDLEQYQPLNPEHCRELLGIPKTASVLLFAVENLGNRRKGGDLLQAALAQLDEQTRSNLVLLTFGQGGESLSQGLNLPMVHLGYVQNARLKAIAYSAADLYLLPTRADNYPLAIQESFACGTPVVSFAVGGVPELVQPGKTGYLAPPEQVAEFRRGITTLLGQDLQAYRQACRDFAEQHFQPTHQAQRYLDRYHHALDRFQSLKSRRG